MLTVIPRVADTKVHYYSPPSDMHRESCSCIENSYRFNCVRKQSRTPILSTQVKPRQRISAESEVSHLTLGLGNFMLVRAHVIVGSAEDQSEVHCHHGETKASPWTLLQGLTAWGWEEGVRSLLLNAGNKCPENLLTLKAGAPRRCGSGAW